MAKKKSPKISIIIPVYNADLYLEECLNSVVNQTLKDIEVICVNDNSKDKSLKILQKYAKNDTRIKVINFEETCGQSRARNVALEAVSGEYIGFVDADDFVDVDMFEKMYKKSQNADMVMCRAKVFDDKVKTYKDDGYFALECFDDKFAKKPFNHEDTKEFTTEINVSVWNKIYRTDFLQKCGVKFQEGFIYEDLPYFYEVYTQAEKVVLVNEFLYSYRVNNQNSTMTRTDKNVKDRVDMASRAYDVLKKQKYFEEIKSNVLNTMIHDLFYRCLIIDSRYQKEYFFRMQKFFKTLDTTGVDDTLIKSRYYPHFCEIKKRSYEEIVKYFFNQETLGAAYVEHAKKVFKRDFDDLELKKRDFLKEKEFLLGEIDRERSDCEREKSENAKNVADLKKSKSELDKLWKDFEKSKKSKLAELNRLQAKILQDEKKRYAEFEKQNESKNADFERQKGEIAQEWAKIGTEREKRLKELTVLQDKILQDEKTRWADFEQKNNEKKEEFAAQQADLDVEWQKLETEKAEQDDLISAEWKKIENERIEQAKLIETEWEKFEKEKAERVALIELEWKKFDKEKAQRVALLEAEWKKFEEEKVEQAESVESEWKRIDNEKAERAALIDAEWKKIEKERAEQAESVEAEWKKIDEEKSEQAKLVEDEWKRIEEEKSEQTKLVEDEWKKIDEEKSEQAKLVEDEWKKIEAEWAEQTGLIEAERKKLEEEKVEQSSLIESEWKRLETEKTEKQSELDNAWAAFKADDEKHKVETAKAWEKLEKEYSVKQTELDKAWKNLEIDTLNKQIELDKAWKDFAEETKVKQAEVDAAWEKFKQDTAEREKNLDVLQDRILSDEKERWKKFEDETALKKAELQEKEAELIREFDLKKQNLNKLEDELWQKVNARQEELKKGEYELDKAWEKFKIDNLTREKELDNKQSEILSDEKERWKKYELQVAEFERKKVEFDKEKELMLKEIDRQWADFEKEKQSQQKENEHQRSDFEKEKQSQLNGIERQREDFEKEKQSQLDEIEHRRGDFEKEKQSQLDEIERQRGDLAKEKQAQLDEIERQRGDLAKEKQAQLDEIERQRGDLAKEKQAQLDEIERQRGDLAKEKQAQLDEIERQRGDLAKEKQAQLDEIERQRGDLAKEKQSQLDEIERQRGDLAKEKQAQLDEIERQRGDLAKEKQAQLDEIERQRGDLAKEKQAQLDDIEHQRDDFAKEKQSQLDEIEHQRVDFEKEKEFQLCEIDRRHKFEKLTVEKTKNYLSNRYLTEIEEEKTKLAKHYAEEVSGRDEYFADLLKQQLRLQEENYKKTDIFKEKVKDDMTNRPKVSIILPVYNVAPYLRQSLDSIIAQTLSDIEIICVDDGSTDESGKILDEYKEKDARIKVIHKKNAGTGAARNDGLRIATGECIGFVDPDDWILPNMYERLYNILQDKELDIVMFTPDVFNDQTQKHEGFLYFQDSNFPKFLDDKIFNKDDISPFSYPMCVWNKLYRKKLFDDNNIDFAEGLDFEDHKVIFKSLFTAKRIYFIREKLYVYRHSRQGSILSDNDTRMFDHIKIYDIVENILKETGNWEKFHLDFLRYKVHNILYYYTMIKPQYKEEYYKKMVKSLQNTRMSEEEFETLAKDYPELKPIMGDTFVNKLKNAVKKIIKG